MLRLDLAKFFGRAPVEEIGGRPPPLSFRRRQAPNG
jgi:hypothetical protein